MRGWFVALKVLFRSLVRCVVSRRCAINIGMGAFGAHAGGMAEVAAAVEVLSCRCTISLGLDEIVRLSKVFNGDRLGLGTSGVLILSASGHASALCPHPCKVGTGCWSTLVLSTGAHMYRCCGCTPSLIAVFRVTFFGPPHHSIPLGLLAPDTMPHMSVSRTDGQI